MNPQTYLWIQVSTYTVYLYPILYLQPNCFSLDFFINSLEAEIKSLGIARQIT